MSGEFSERPTWIDSLDKAVFGFFELLGLVFALPFGDALYQGMPISKPQIAFLILGAACGAAGPMWPLIRAKASTPLTASLERAAKDARTWIAVLLFAFGYFFFRPTVTPSSPSLSASGIAEAVAVKVPRTPTADEIADAIVRRASETQQVQIVNYGLDGPQQFHAIVNIKNWQEYRKYKGILVMRTSFADRDRMTDDWIAKSIPYTIDGPMLTLVTKTNNQMRFNIGIVNEVEYNFVIIPDDKVPEQVRMLGDVEKLGGKILATAAQGIPNMRPPDGSPDTTSSILPATH